jgi:hypothetical protein
MDGNMNNLNKEGAKTVEKLIVSTKCKTKNNGTSKPENEQINSAVMKVLQGYDWTLVPATTK